MLFKRKVFFLKENLISETYKHLKAEYYIISKFEFITFNQAYACKTTKLL